MVSLPRLVIAAPSTGQGKTTVVAGLALYAVIVFKLHEWLIGVAPLG